jgi:PBP1b-binding outer membrane lipoprotein LpoB
MKKAYALLLGAALCLIGGCASDQTVTETAPTGAVAGEKVGGTDVTPGMGPSGAGANVHF